VNERPYTKHEPNLTYEWRCTHTHIYTRTYTSVYKEKGGWKGGEEYWLHIVIGVALQNLHDRTVLTRVFVTVLGVIK
jgi:hypothetical protein